jgi:hypothetical protein
MAGEKPRVAAVRRDSPSQVHNAKRHAAQTHRLFEHRIEHRRQISRRRIDDLQHLGGGGLLLQRLALLGQEAGVFDRDDRLVGKGADQLDLSLGERLDPRAREADGADHHTLA